jgi:hypothetical protein
MNSRIYHKEVFLKELERLKDQGRIYCPHCYSTSLKKVELSYSKYKLKSRVRGLTQCFSCYEIFKTDEVLNKIGLRDKKIGEVLD